MLTPEQITVFAKQVSGNGWWSPTRVDREFAKLCYAAGAKDMQTKINNHLAGLKSAAALCDRDDPNIEKILESLKETT